MSIELIVVIANIIGLVCGMLICRDGIKERDKRIKELEDKLNEN